MGSSILTGKRAGALQKADGEWIYALFERGYESNVYPHTDHWSAVALGNYAQVMRRVFSHATSCEGGMLRSRNGSIRPENYIESWRRELAKPALLRDRTIDLSVGSSCYSAVPESQLDDVRRSLIRAGFESRIDELVGRSLSVSLHADIDLLLSIYGNSGPLSVWRVLKEYDCGTSQIEVPVPSATKTAMERMPDVRCYAIDGDNRLIAVGDERLRHGGWQYNTVGSFITEVAYAIEMEMPGFAKRAIPHFREIVRKASPVPRDTKLTVTRIPDGASKWSIETADELARGLGIVGAKEAAPSEFTFGFREVVGEMNSLLLHKLGSLREHTVWSVQRRDDAERTPLIEACIAAETQLSLCL